MIGLDEKEFKEREEKLKVESIERCLNCEYMVECKEIGYFEECESFKEVEDRDSRVVVWVREYIRLKDLEEKVKEVCEYV